MRWYCCSKKYVALKNWYENTAFQIPAQINILKAPLMENLVTFSYIIDLLYILDIMLKECLTIRNAETPFILI
jgi:hypothetical protein